MSILDGFARGVASEILPHVSGTDAIAQATHDLLAHTFQKRDKLPYKLLKDEISSMLDQGQTLFLCGIPIACLGYWILRDNFMATIALFYSAQPSLLLALVREAVDALSTRDGSFSGDMTHVIQHAIITVSYAYTCTFMHFCIPLSKALMPIVTGHASNWEFGLFWSITFVALAWFQYAANPWTPFMMAYHSFCTVDSIARTPRNALILLLVKSSLYTLHYGILCPLNWLVHYYYRIETIDPPWDWLFRDYEYQPLTEEGQIRLLRIPRRFLGEWDVFPGLFFNFPGNCHLELVPLDQAPPYECISYTWSQGPQSIALEVDGKRMNVTQQVFDILGERRSFLKDRLIWIDSICINQKDISEKTNQIPLMGKIYKTAIRVVVHLGDIGDRHASASIRSMIRNFGIIPSSVATSLGSSAAHSLATSYNNTREWDAFLELLSHQWFSRVWVVQEVAVASSLAAIIGDNYIPWQLLEEAIQIVYQSHVIKLNNGRDRVESAANLLKMLNLRTRISRGEKPRFGDILTLFHNFNSTEPRDKIIALVGISDAAEDTLQLVDYICTAEELVCRVAEYLIGRDQYFDVVHAAGVGWNEELNGFPSWVPDWTRQPKNLRGFILSHGWERHPFTASAGWPASLVVDPGGRTCATRGCRIGTLVELAEPPDIDSAEGDDTALVMIIAEWLMRTRAMMERYFPSSDSFRDREFWTTLVGGRDDKGDFVSDDFLDKIRSWEVLMGDRPALEASLKPFGPRPLTVEEMASYVQLMDSKSGVGVRIAETCYGARFAVVENGFMAIAPPLARKGDIAYILFGAKTPLLLRPTNSGRGGYELVGECYVQGAMHGELGEWLDPEEIVLV